MDGRHIAVGQELISLQLCDSMPYRHNALEVWSSSWLFKGSECWEGLACVLSDIVLCDGVRENCAARLPHFAQ